MAVQYQRLPDSLRPPLALCGSSDFTKTWRRPQSTQGILVIRAADTASSIHKNRHNLLDVSCARKIWREDKANLGACLKLSEKDGWQIKNAQLMQPHAQEYTPSWRKRHPVCTAQLSFSKLHLRKAQPQVSLLGLRGQNPWPRSHQCKSGAPSVESVWSDSVVRQAKFYKWMA